MKKSLHTLLVAVMSCSYLLLPALAIPSTNDNGTREWNFKVYLGNSKIGYHNFRLTQNEQQQHLVTEANFKVRFLFLTAYEYEHTNMETWRGDCLQRIDSQTDANGKMFSVSGSRRQDGFVLESSGETEEVAGCVRTFAYWNPDFLEAPALLNPQTGEILPISVDLVAKENIIVRGQEVEAQRYKLRARDVDLDIWYSGDREWLGLRSTTKDGRTIRYELN